MMRSASFLALLLMAPAAAGFAQSDGGQQTLAAPPTFSAFAVPNQFHGRWLPVEAGCSNAAGNSPSIISAEGLRRGDNWVEPVELMALSDDGLRLEMQADHYFQAPPVLYRSVWQLSEDRNQLVIRTAAETAAATGRVAPGPSALVRCDG